jgi:hypothetical protein
MCVTSKTAGCWELARDPSLTCADFAVIVKASSGPRYVVSYRPTLPVHKVRPSCFHCLPGRELNQNLSVEGRRPSLTRYDNSNNNAHPTA